MRRLLILHAIAATALLSPKRRRRAPTKDDGWREHGPATPLAPRTDYDWTSGAPTDAACWPSVSVVTITRDRADFLAEALVSMVRQDYPRDRVEMIVADDGAGGESSRQPSSFVGARRRRFGASNAVAAMAWRAST